ncbi:DinB family protein [Paenibacillus sp. NPDC057886]|uniref:DinB family protein n=1 Tax=Paenibacillus sp. NPDC057886 TaxID=3346270 RepID=UPI0036B0B9D5
MLEDRQRWNQQQKELKSILLKPSHYERALELLVIQHATVHSAGIVEPPVWSFEDEVLNPLPEETFRRLPKSGANSIAWHIYHSTRIEDMTMNTLVANRTQVIYEDHNWLQRMNINVHDTGNGMDEERLRTLSTSVDISALRAYRLAVGLRTSEIMKMLTPEEYRRKVEVEHLRGLRDAGDVTKEASWLLEYWGNLTVAGLFLMPATRHHFVHLNKSLRISK